MAGSFFLIMFVATLVLLVLVRLTVERIERNHYNQKSDFYHSHPVNKGDIVFMGDSITDGANWDELFPGLPVKSRGINADTTTGVLNRIGYTLCCSPAAIFLLIGTNDLPLFEYRKDNEILATYRQILQQCKEGSPETKVYVQSILPRTHSFEKRILHINQKLAALAAEFGFEFIDLYSHFVSPKGSLRDELTNDHLHLMAPGYVLWVKLLDPYIAPYRHS